MPAAVKPPPPSHEMILSQGLPGRADGHYRGSGESAQTPYPVETLGAPSCGCRRSTMAQQQKPIGAAACRRGNGRFSGRWAALPVRLVVIPFPRAVVAELIQRSRILLRICLERGHWEAIAVAVSRHTLPKLGIDTTRQNTSYHLDDSVMPCQLPKCRTLEIGCNHFMFPLDQASNLVVAKDCGPFCSSPDPLPFRAVFTGSCASWGSYRPCIEIGACPFVDPGWQSDSSSDTRNLLF